MKLKSYKLLSIVTAVAVFASIPFGVAAKSQSANGSSTKKVEQKAKAPATKSDSKVAPKTTTKKVNETKKPSVKPKATTKAKPKAIKAKKPQPKNAVLNQLATIEKKLATIEKDTEKISVTIAVYTESVTSAVYTTESSVVVATEPTVSTTDSETNTTGTPTSPTTDTTVDSTTQPAAGTTTGTEIESTSDSTLETEKINKTAFINSTKGKLKALSNRLSAVEKSLKALTKKTDKKSIAKYKSLVSRMKAAKVNISKQIEILKGLDVEE